MSTSGKKPIINCHTHIFTGDHVPPFLAKTYLPWPLYWIIPLNGLVGFFRFWNKRIVPIRYSVPYKRWVRIRTAIAQFFIWLGPISTILGYYLMLVTLLYANDLVKSVWPSMEIEWMTRVMDWLVERYFIINFDWKGWELIIVILLLLFFSSVRNMVLFIAKQFWKILSKLPGKETTALLKRYLNIGRYAFHEKQTTILGKLKAQYPPDTGIVALPMDMEYMGAGQPPHRYRDQMQELAALKEQKRYKDCLFPFLFIDPRRCDRTTKEKNLRAGDQPFLEYTYSEGTVSLSPCFVKSYMEDKQFSGLKIYPALGYYPFDERLLPLWKWAADNGFPILTHCIRGTIFYRGPKKNEWNEHPVFEQAMGKKKKATDGQEKPEEDQADWNDDHKRDDRIKKEEEETQYESLVLPQMKNVDFSANFTHPMNFLCLLHEPLLRKLVYEGIQHRKVTGLKEIFGFVDINTPLKYNLSHLKICLGHFGGDDEWRRYFEKDRYNFRSQLIKNPGRGIEFFQTYDKQPSRGKPEQVWKYTDWYSIICSMMLQYPNVYADISYILHDNADVMPLLKQTLQNPKLRGKVLYGTDFFVVRNHKSDKNMLTDYEGGLSTADFDTVARDNPRVFLTNKLQGAPKIQLSFLSVLMCNCPNFDT